MKESSGELSMTVVVIVGAVALVGLIGWVIQGPAKNYIDNWFTNMECVDADNNGICD